MTPVQPPRMATWLLKRLASGPHRQSLAGDLVEQYQRRRSARWYWWQVLVAIVTGAIHDLRMHPIVALRGLAFFYVLSWAAVWTTTYLHQALGLMVWNWTVDRDFDMLRVLWFGRPAYGSPLFLACLWMDAMVIGWTVARMHRGLAAAVLLGCLILSSVYALALPQGWMPWWPLLFSTQNGRFAAPFPFWVEVLGVRAAFVIGGVLGSSSAPLSDDSPSATHS